MQISFLQPDLNSIIYLENIKPVSHLGYSVFTV